MSIKKRILIVNDLLIGGGVEKLMYDLTLAMHVKYDIKIMTDEKSVSKLETMLEKVIDEKLGRKFERHIALLSKSAKASFSSIFLQAYVLAYIFNSEDDQQFIKDKINLANKLGYQAIKSPYFEDDITRILPKDLNFKNLI